MKHTQENVNKELLRDLKAIVLAATMTCPRDMAWKNLIETCQNTIDKADKEGA